MNKEFKEGQIWAYSTRPNEKDSQVLILKIEHYELPAKVDVFHIALNGLQLKNPNSGTGVSSEIEHLPFSKKAIENSLTTLLEENAWIHAYGENYEEWKKAFLSQQVGVFDMTIKAALTSTEESIKDSK